MSKKKILVIVGILFMMWYVITSPANPTKVTLKIKAVRIKEGKTVKEVIKEIDLPKVTGTSCATWDGKDKDDKFVEDWLFTVQIEAFFATPHEPEPVKSNLHQITELSEKHKPKIFLHKNEFCGPIHFKLMGSDGMYEKDNYIEGTLGTPILTLLTNALWNTINHYLNFDENDLKRSHLNTRKVFSRGKVEDDLVFVQYWMFYPSSTEGTNNAKDKEVKPYHEGDWEMMQVVVKLDKEKKALKPQAITASQHYYGQTIQWPGVPPEKPAPLPEEQYVRVANKTNPTIYIACGSHATYFRNRIFATQLGSANSGIQYELRFWQMALGKMDFIYRIKEKAEQYNLKPFDPLEAPNLQMVEWWLWEGHWGEYRKSKGKERAGKLIGVQKESSSGPRSPKYRGTAVDISPPIVIKIFDEPKRFYEKYKIENIGIDP